MTITIRAAECARLIRRALGEAFPGIRMRVRTNRYAGGATVHVHWEDGPTTDDVERVAKVFEGCSFDGRTDEQIVKAHTLDGQRVRFAVTCVMCDRRYSPGFLAAVVQFAMNRDPLLIGRTAPRIEADPAAGAHMVDDVPQLVTAEGATVRDIVMRHARAMPAGVYAGESKTARCVRPAGGSSLRH